MERVFTLDDGQQVTANQVAKRVGISRNGAWARLVASTAPSDIFRSPGTVTRPTTAQTFTLSDGNAYTVSELEARTGIRAATLRARLARSNDYDYVTRLSDYAEVNATVYHLNNSEKLTVSQYARKQGITPSRAYGELQALSCETSRYEKTFRLNDGKNTTVGQVMKMTGLSYSGAKKRLAKSLVPDEVFAPVTVEKRTMTKVTAAIKQRTTKARPATKVTVELHVPTSDGLLVQKGYKHSGQFMKLSQQFYPSL